VLALALAPASACERGGPASTPPETAGEPAAGGGESVPPSVAKLDAIAGAVPLGAKMWRRFGDGEWRATTFFVPGSAGELTVYIDMEGGGEALIKPFELLVRLEGAELVEGSLRMPGRVPPGQFRREQLRIRASAPGIVKIHFATLKEGNEAGGTSGCISVVEGGGVQRCTASQDAGAAAPPG
jgi:hypothetical protein